MQSPTKISYRSVEPSATIEDHVHRRIDELERTYPGLIGCDVVIDAPQKRKVNANLFEVRLTLRIPGPDIHVSRSMGRSGAIEDLNLAIHKAFDAARRLLKEKRRVMDAQEVKHHAPVLHGRIDRLFEGEGYGFIAADDGRELYFERDSLVDGAWNDLRVDMRLRFRQMDGEKGPFAVGVSIAEID